MRSIPSGESEHQQKVNNPMRGNGCGRMRYAADTCVYNISYELWLDRCMAPKPVYAKLAQCPKQNAIMLFILRHLPNESLRE